MAAGRSLDEDTAAALVAEPTFRSIMDTCESTF